MKGRIHQYYKNSNSHLGLHQINWDVGTAPAYVPCVACLMDIVFSQSLYCDINLLLISFKEAKTWWGSLWWQFQWLSHWIEEIQKFLEKEKVQIPDKLSCYCSGRSLKRYQAEFEIMRCIDGIKDAQHANGCICGRFNGERECRNLKMEQQNSSCFLTRADLYNGLQGQITCFEILIFQQFQYSLSTIVDLRYTGN